MTIVLFILVCVVSIVLLFYLRKRTIDQYYNIIETVKPIINGKWIKGKTLEGEYKERKVQCGIIESGFLLPNINILLKVKLNRSSFNKEEWIDWRIWRMIVSPNEQIHFSLKEFSKESFFIEQLEKLYQFCEKVEKGEVFVKL